MTLIAIVCPKCSRQGYAGELPRVLTCATCAHTALFRTGERIIRGWPDPEPKAKPPPSRKRILTPNGERRRLEAEAALSFRR